jgi:UDP-N-acetylmuramyl pentapeptide synthase
MAPSQGERFDGHQFLPQIAQGGCIGAIGSEPPPAGWYKTLFPHLWFDLMWRDRV